MKKVIILVALMVVPQVSFAAGYGSAGCGLGSMILGGQKGILQVFAATTNGTSGSQTFGITSGTSNCGGGGKTATQFIEVNKTSLKNDIAKGDGETLAALSEIYGCEQPENFGQTLKTNYRKIFSAKDAKSIDLNIKNILKKNYIICNA